MSKRTVLLWALVVVGGALLVGLGGRHPKFSPSETARFMADLSGFTGGVCVVIEGEEELALSLAKQGRFVVQALYGRKDKVREAREAIRGRGLYGRVSADVLYQPDRLPYADNLINILVAPDFEALSRRGLEEEVFRVLRPLGMAFLGVAGESKEVERALKAAGFREVRTVEKFGRWVVARKPWPEDIDEWTHFAHGPDGNPVAHDSVVGQPRHIQWVSEPLWLRDHDTDSSIMAVVTARGRLFYFEDKGPIGVVGNHPLPDNWHLVCRDAFNGVLLWEVPIRRWGWREWKDTWYCRRPWDIPLNIHRRLVAVGDRVYVTLGYHAPVSELDAGTGMVLRTFEGTEEAREILVCKGVLIASVKRGEGLKLLALDLRDGRRLWEAGPFKGTKNSLPLKTGFRELEPVLNPATDGRVVALLDGPEVVCLDFRTGRERWRSRPTEGEGDLWLGALIVHDKVVLYASNERLHSLSVEDGRVLWSRPIPNLGWLWFDWQDVFVIDGLVWTWSPDLGVRKKGGGGVRVYPLYADGLDPETGKVVRRVPLGGIFNTIHHHRCYPNRATLRYIIASRRGAEFVDLKEGLHTVNNWIRGTCHFGNLPANGLFYVTPHPCVCYNLEKLFGFYALSARASEGAKGPALEKGPAYGTKPLPEAKEEWPTYLHDNMRTLHTEEDVPPSVKVAWEADLGGKPSAPVAAGGMVFVSVPDKHEVLAFDARTGRKVWEFTAGGRVRVPPTYWRGLLLFGCADGWVYCLRASDGKLCWRFRAAPEERRVVAFGQFESPWPVDSGVIVQNGIAYFAAGRSSHLDGGIFVYGLDPATGRVVHRTVVSGPDLNVKNIEDNINPKQGLVADLIQGDGEAVYIHHLKFSSDLKEVTEAGVTRVRAISTLLDPSYFKRSPWILQRTREWGRIICLVRGKTAVMARMFRTLRCLDPENFFTPGQGYLLLARPAGVEAKVAYVEVRNSPTLGPNKRPLTVEAWALPDAPNGVVLAHGGRAWGYALYLKGGRPHFSVRLNQKVYTIKGRGKVVGRWAHLVGVITEKGEMRLFVDGKLVAEGRAPGTVPTPGQMLQIGADLGDNVGEYDSPFPFYGLIDEVRVYHRPLSEEEVREHFLHPERIRPEEALALYFPFDKGEAKDASGKGNDGKVAGAKPAPGRVGTALKFERAKGVWWEKVVPIRVRAMLVAGDVVWLSGPPDAILKPDPFAAFEGRSRGLLWALSAKDGRKLAEYTLERPPVFNGMAVAEGRLFVATTGGSLICFGP